MVGDVATGMPLPSIPFVPLTTIPYLVLGAAGIVFLAVGESVGAGRAYAARHHYEIDPDQEMLALGAANLASGLFGGFTADASLSQTATAESAGAKSQLVVAGHVRPDPGHGRPAGAAVPEPAQRGAGSHRDRRAS